MIALVDLELTESEFFSMPPYKMYLLQLQNQRRIERRWEQTRSIMAMQHNTAMGKKRNIRVNQIVSLSFDEIIEYDEWTQEDAEQLIEKWPDISKN